MYVCMYIYIYIYICICIQRQPIASAIAVTPLGPANTDVTQASARQQVAEVPQVAQTCRLYPA